jgi:hypothetical protein
LNIKTFWSINENELVVGQGNIEGNAVQLLQFIKEHQLYDKIQMSAEHFDKVLYHFGVEVFFNKLWYNNIEIIVLKARNNNLSKRNVFILFPTV